MITPDINTDFSQLEDAAEHTRRITDQEDCPREGCTATQLLEHRVDRHRLELNELKVLLKENTETTQKNNDGIAEVLDIVRLAKGFFKVLGWIASGLKILAGIGGPIAAFVYWLKYGEKP